MCEIHIKNARVYYSSLAMQAGRVSRRLSSLTQAVILESSEDCDFCIPVKLEAFMFTALKLGNTSSLGAP